MRLLSKVFICLLVMIIVVQTLPIHASAETDTLNDSNEGIVYGEKLDHTVNYFRDEELLELAGTIAYRTNVRIMEERETATLVEFMYYEEREIKYSRGFVDPKYILSVKEAALFEEYIQVNGGNLTDFIELQVEKHIESKGDQESDKENNSGLDEIEYLTEEEMLERNKQGTDKTGNLDESKNLEDYTTHDEKESKQLKERIDNNLEESQEVKSAKEHNIDTQDKLEDPSNDDAFEEYTQTIEIEETQLAKQMYGLAVLEKTSVYSETSKDSAILRSYSQGHLLEFRPYNSEWYEATVNINGKWEDGFIHRKDVDPLLGEEISQQNYALKQPTQVYTNPTRSGEVLRGYQAGHLLQYRTYSSTWHIATVYINGEPKTGYIHADDVGPRENIRLRGVASLQPTSVYSETSKDSAILRSYSQGHLLEFRPYNSEWYEATVSINGKWENGFINKKDVDLLDPIQKQLTGLAMRGSTNVFSSPSTTSRTLRSYSEGHILQYRNFSANWYEATVYLNGKATLGYIHKNHVNSIQGKRIVLDPGHGGNDPGAIANGLIEKNLNLDIALKTKNLLERAGATVIMTRTTDIFITLQNRALIANTSNADIFISIHNNAFNGIANGTETFWHGRNERANSIRLANSLQNAVVSKAGTTNRRVAEGNFHVIRETLIPSALLEVAFMDHLGDAEKLSQQSFLHDSAKGILIGITNYFN
ncbi:N-acetylmuramoyl-L-alanine amidase [Shouchella miscanthi]|uniref:N-acetylmuramoyl-L-alanine amidase n=1 Tax=Shouchella miscanthi TaxID=2598861 RepID=A0ABU6NRI9_9BACI|nr:N-acetylmuramoyl-L-alanine amidase [Shouchella miscanthi]